MASQVWIVAVSPPCNKMLKMARAIAIFSTLKEAEQYVIGSLRCDPRGSMPEDADSSDEEVLSYLRNGLEEDERIYPITDDIEIARLFGDYNCAINVPIAWILKHSLPCVTVDAIRRRITGHIV